MTQQSAPKFTEAAIDVERVLLDDIESVSRRVEDGEPVLFIHWAAGDGMSWNRNGCVSATGRARST